MIGGYDPWRKVGNPTWLDMMKTVERYVEVLELLDVVARRSRGASSGAAVVLPDRRVSFAVYPQLVGYWSEKINGETKRIRVSAKQVFVKLRGLVCDCFRAQRE